MNMEYGLVTLRTYMSVSVYEGKDVICLLHRCGRSGMLLLNDSFVLQPRWLLWQASSRGPIDIPILV